MRTVIVSGARALAALDIMRAFHGSGWRVVAVDSMALPPARFSRAVDRFRRIAGPALQRERFANDVEMILKEAKPDLWIATCEEIFYLAALKAERRPELPLFAPPLEALLAVHDKARFAEAAACVGLAPDETIRLTGKEDVARVSRRARDLVFKPVWSRFAERVMIQPEARDLKSLAPSPHDPWIAQTFLPGEEVCTYGIAEAGRLLLHAAYRPRHRVRAGAGIYFEPAADEEIRAAVTALVQSLAWSGQIAFDFRRDALGRWKAIECNPRATSGVHLLPPAALVAAFEGAALNLRVPTPPQLNGAPSPPVIPRAVQHASVLLRRRRISTGFDGLPEDPVSAAQRDRRCTAHGMTGQQLEAASVRACSEEPRMIGAAMVAFGLPAAVRDGRVSQWRHDTARARDVASVPGDHGPGAAQLLFLAEGITRALRYRVGLTRAATLDLEWNGGEEGQP